MTQTATKTIIQVPMKNTRTKQWTPFWIKSVRYADGPGMKVKSWAYTSKIEEAAKFSLVSAQEIAAQFFHIVGISLRNEDGSVKAEATSTLHQMQTSKIEARNEVVREYNRQMEPLVKEIKNIIGRL